MSPGMEIEDPDANLMNVQIKKALIFLLAKMSDQE
jgi:hypothetical protein